MNIRDTTWKSPWNHAWNIESSQSALTCSAVAEAKAAWSLSEAALCVRRVGESLWCRRKSPRRLRCEAWLFLLGETEQITWNLWALIGLVFHSFIHSTSKSCSKLQTRMFIEIFWCIRVFFQHNPYWAHTVQWALCGALGQRWVRHGLPTRNTFGLVGR